MSESSPTVFYIETRRYDEPFTRDDRFFDNPSENNFASIEAAQDHIMNNEMVTEKRSSRIVDSSNRVVAEFHESYEPVMIDIMRPGREWINAIRDTYGLTTDEWRVALEDWLAAQ